MHEKSRMDQHAPGAALSIHQRIQRDRFDRLAASWESEHGPRSPRRTAYRQRHAYLRRVCQTVPAARVLDVGCGTGTHLRELTGVMSLGKGIDLSEEMIAQARHRIHRSADAARLGFEVLAAEAVGPGRLGTFDIALFVHSLEYMEDPAAALERVASVVEPDGLIVVLMARPGDLANGGVQAAETGLDGCPARSMSPRQIAHVAARMGWRLSGISDFRPLEVVAGGFRPITSPQATPACDANVDVFAARLRRLAPRSAASDL